MTQRTRRHSVGLTMILAAAIASSSIGQVIFDGTIRVNESEEWGQAKVNALQDNHTGYGDQLLGPGGFPGSELDELYVRTDGTWLYVGVTGNLEQNGNSIVLLFDTGVGGQNVLATEIAPRADELPCAANGPPYAVQGLGRPLIRNDGGTPDDVSDDVTSRDPAGTGTRLDAGFAATHAIAVDTRDGRVYVTQYNLSSTPLGNWDDPSTGFGGCAPSPDPASNEALPYYATRVYRGSGNVNSDNGTLTGGTNPGNSLFAFNNTGKLGVTGESTTPPPAPGSGLPGDPRTQTTGLEAKIRLTDLGYAGTVTSLNIRMAVLLTSENGFVSNQTLPSIGGGTSLTNLGWRPDFTAVAGNQYATVTRNTSAALNNIDGKNIVTEFGLTNLVASQDTVTSFGDRNCLVPTNGSELDELFLRTDGHYLYVAVTGNLESQGNAQILLLDLHPGGQNTLKTEVAPVVSELPCSSNTMPQAVQGLGQALTKDGNNRTIRDPLSSGTILDNGFEPDYAIAVDAGGGSLHVSQYTLSATALGLWDDPGQNNDECGLPDDALEYFATRIYRGSIPLGATSTGPGSLTNGTNPNGSEFAFDNNGVAGVTGSQVAAPGSGLTGDPRTQTRGLEARISLLDLGFAPHQLPVNELAVKAMVLLTSADGLVSNQTLPGTNLGTSIANLGFRPAFPGVSGEQFVTANLTAGAFSPTIDGRDLVNKYGTSNVLASQNTVTGFGNVTLVPVADCDQAFSPGSEIDRLVVQDTQGDIPALQIGITANLESRRPDGSGSNNTLIIFLDTIPDAGESVLDANSGRVGGMSGVTLPMQADYAVYVNIFQATAYVDMVNLITNQQSYVGNASGGWFPQSGYGEWLFAFDNTNTLGVSAIASEDPQTAKASTARTGFELSIPLSAIGSPADGTQVCVFAIITNDNGQWLSNQILPAGLGGGRGNFNNTRPDFAALGYQCGSLVLGPVGPTCNAPRFDIDGDGDVDMDDFAVLQRCWTGPLAAGFVTPECECFDWNLVQADGKINLEDFAAFQNCASGSNMKADPDCATLP